MNSTTQMNVLREESLSLNVIEMTIRGEDSLTWWGQFNEICAINAETLNK